MKLIYNLSNRWLLCCLFFIVSCTTHKKHELKNKTSDVIKYKDSIATSCLMIHDGDIITRTGNDFTSENLRLLNIHDKTFSHCGIAMTENGTAYVFHAIGGDWNPDQALTKEPFDSFVNPKNNRGFGIYRFNLSEKETKQLKWLCNELYNIKLPFDINFDLKTDDKMYCAEFTGKCLEWSSDKNLKIPISRIRDFEFIGVDDIILHPDSRKIINMMYK